MLASRITRDCRIAAVRACRFQRRAGARSASTAMLSAGGRGRAREDDGVGELLAIGSALAWALTSVAMRPIAGRALWRSSVLRSLLCGLALAAYAWPTGIVDQVLHAEPRAFLWLLGSTLSSIVIGDSLYFLAAARIGVARALPIASSFPLITTAGAVLLLGEAFTPGLLLGSIMVVLGVALVGGERAPSSGRVEPLGLLLAGLAACLWASSGLFLGPALQLLDPVAANLVRFPVATLFFVGYVALARPSEDLTPRLLWLTVAAAAGTLSSAMLFLGGITGAGVARGVALNATSPIFSAVLAVVLLKEHLSRRAAIGVACSVLGTILLVV
jgi:drug/metabolite transporter, DME family